MSDLIVPSRRGFLLGLGAALVTAPAIVRVASIMPVRVPRFVTGTEIAIRQRICLDEFSRLVLKPMVDRLANQVAAAIMAGNDSPAFNLNMLDDEINIELIEPRGKPVFYPYALLSRTVE